MGHTNKTTKQNDVLSVVPKGRKNKLKAKDILKAYENKYGMLRNHRSRTRGVGSLKGRISRMGYYLGLLPQVKRDKIFVQAAFYYKE